MQIIRNDKKRVLRQTLVSKKARLTNETLISLVVEINGNFLGLKSGDYVNIYKGDLLSYNKQLLDINEGFFNGQEKALQST